MRSKTQFYFVPGFFDFLLGIIKHLTFVGLRLQRCFFCLTVNGHVFRPFSKIEACKGGLIQSASFNSIFAKHFSYAQSIGAGIFISGTEWKCYVLPYVMINHHPFPLPLVCRYKAGSSGKSAIFYGRFFAYGANNSNGLIESAYRPTSQLFVLYLDFVHRRYKFVYWFRTSTRQ